MHAAIKIRSANNLTFVFFADKLLFRLLELSNSHLDVIVIEHAFLWRKTLWNNIDIAPSTPIDAHQSAF